METLVSSTNTTSSQTVNPETQRRYGTKTVSLTDTVYKQVRKHGTYGDSFSDIIGRVFSDYEQRIADESVAARGVF